MTIEELQATFDKYSDEVHSEFAGVKDDRRLSSRPDLCAFLLLTRLVPSDKDIVSGAEHDQIWISTDVEHLAVAATDEDVETLVRCGVMLDEETGDLCMFV